MKESVLDILMYLFENYMEEDPDTHADQESLRRALVEAGYPDAEIDKAFGWLEGLTAQQQDQARQSWAASDRAIRIFTDQEAEKLDLECRGFLLFLEQLGVLDQGTRELVVDRVMALESEEISLEQLKWVILMVLFNQPGQEAAFAWMEDLVYEDMAGYLH